jgi:hypothetical protein
MLKFSVCFHLCVPVRKHDHSFVSDTQLDNLILVTRSIGGVPSKNHQGRSSSTGHKNTASQNLDMQDPFEQRASPWQKSHGFAAELLSAFQFLQKSTV